MAEVQILVERFPGGLAIGRSISVVTNSPTHGGPAERKSNTASVSTVRGIVGIEANEPLVHQDGELANGVVTLQWRVFLGVMQSTCDKTRNGLVFASDQSLKSEMSATKLSSRFHEPRSTRDEIRDIELAGGWTLP